MLAARGGKGGPDYCGDERWGGCRRERERERGGGRGRDCVRGAWALGDFEFLGEWVLCCEDGGGGGRGEVCGGVGVLEVMCIRDQACLYECMDKIMSSGLESDVTVYSKYICSGSISR